MRDTDQFSARKSKVNAKEYKTILWAFGLSVAFTLFAFIAVGTNAVESALGLGLFILLLAVIQVAVQLFYFMHLKERGHHFPLFSITTGLFVAIVSIYGMLQWLWH
jgi:cytochrome c oxidase subunit 4